MATLAGKYDMLCASIIIISIIWYMVLVHADTPALAYNYTGTKIVRKYGLYRIII